MADIELQFENTKQNSWDLLNDLFESDGWHEGMTREIPSCGTLTLKNVPMRKGVGMVSLITLVLSIPPAVSSIIGIAKYISSKSKKNNVSNLWINQKQIDVSPEGIVKVLETTLSLSAKTPEWIKNERSTNQTRESKSMEDYQIKSDGRGSFGVSAQTERAQNRAARPPGTSNLTLCFKARADALQFVRAGEAEGFTFEGKELLGS